MKTEKDLEAMKLPKTNYFEQLETISEQNFQLLFDPSRFHFCTKDRSDKGIDLTYELINSSAHTGYRFVVQLKSTESITPNKSDGSYSLSISTANINYLLNSHPAFYVLYDITKAVFYYENITNFLKDLNKKNEIWDESETHVLRFHKILSQEGIDEMYDTALRMGLVVRNLKESATFISASVNNTDRISIDINMNITDDAKIRELIENLGFDLINEGKWNEILFLNNKATGNVAKTSLYNLILGIANYYAGNRFLAKSYLKDAKKLKSDLNIELQNQLQYFDAIVEYSLDLITNNEFDNILQSLENSESIGLYVKLEKSKREYIDSIISEKGEDFQKYVNEINGIINDKRANEALKLSASCELILFEGFKNNHDYIAQITKFFAIEDFTMDDRNGRIALANSLIETHSNWYKKVEKIISEAEKSKNQFAYYTAFTNQVKVSYQFYVYLTILFDVKEGSTRSVNELINLKPISETMIKRLDLSSQFFSKIGHVENVIAAISTKYEILHFICEIEKSLNVMSELEQLINDYDFRNYKERLKNLKDSGTTHETFRQLITSILEKANQRKQEYEELIKEMSMMDEKEKLIKSKGKEDCYHINLYPIGFFQFPINAKEMVYEILQITNANTISHFDELFGIIIPIANIYLCPIESEGHQNGPLANKGIKSWRNIYRIRKAFYENNFYRYENIPGLRNNN